MELTLESAFSTGGLVGHLSYVLLIASMLMRSMVRLRILVILSALTGIAYDWIWLGNPVGVFWEGLLLAVNVGQLALTWVLNRRIDLDPDAAFLAQSRLAGLDPVDQRRLIGEGMWGEGEPGTVLTVEGEEVPFLYFLVSGRVEIVHAGRAVAQCGPGNFIGEMSMIGGGPASATARVSEPARYWMIAPARYRRLAERMPHLATALEAGIAHDLKGKIVASNAAQGGATPA